MLVGIITRCQFPLYEKAIGWWSNANLCASGTGRIFLCMPYYPLLGSRSNNLLWWSCWTKWCSSFEESKPFEGCWRLGCACCCWAVLVKIWGSLSFVIHSRLNPKHNHSQSFKRKVFFKLSEKQPIFLSKQPIVLYLDVFRKDWKLFFKWLNC